MIPTHVSSGISGVTVVVGTQTLTATFLPAAGTPGTGTWTLDMSKKQPNGVYPQPLADGTYNVLATATDNAGNSGSDSTTNELIINTVNALVTVNGLPPTNNSTPTVTGTVLDGSSGLTVTVFNSLGTLVQTLPAIVNGTHWSAMLAHLTDDTYTVTATSSNGFTASNVVILDTKPPTVTVNALPPTNNPRRP